MKWCCSFILLAVVFFGCVALVSVGADVARAVIQAIGG